jgi:hypothetical protein
MLFIALSDDSSGSTGPKQRKAAGLGPYATANLDGRVALWSSGASPARNHLPMNLNDIQTRIRRLDQLRSGFAAEVVRVVLDREPLTTEEHHAYLEAIHATSAGVCRAAAALAGTVQRIKGR